MTTKKIEEQYADLLKDRDLQRYQILAENPNFFEVLRAETYEIRHSNFLSWLLDPKGNHALGDQILKSFLTDLSLDEKSNEFSVFSVQDLDFSHVSVYREWNNLDILLVFDDLVIALENKINHVETKGQLEKYKKLIEKSFKVNHKVFVFMNPYGIDATNENYISYSYETFMDYIDQILALNVSLLPRTRIYLEDYMNNMKNNVLGSGRKNELANKIYRNHKELFEFVYANRSNYIFEIKELIKAKIEARGWIIGSTTKPYLRFLTPKLDEIIPKGLVKGWTDGEAFLFEIYFYANQSTIYAYCTLGPCGDLVRSEFLDFLKPLQTSSKPAKPWSIYRNKTFQMQKYNDLLSEEDKEDLVNDIWNSIEKLVEEVEPILLSHKDRIIELKKLTNNE